MTTNQPQSDIDDQLDAMVESAEQGSDQPGSEGENSPGGSESGGDVAGHEFADQVQKILDEAQTDIDKADQAMENADDAANSPGDDATAGENADDSGSAPGEEEGDDEAQLLSQIDQMLSEQAEDAVAGDFQSVDEVTDEGTEDEQSLPPSPAEAVAGEDASAAGEDATEESDVDGDMQSIDELLAEDDDNVDDSRIRPSTMPLESEKDPPSAFEEPDEPGKPAPGARPQDDPTPLSSGFAAVADEMDTDDQPASEAEADAEPPTGDAGEADDEPGKLMAALAKLNKPVMNWPAFRRDLIGFMGLETFCVGLALLVYAIAGPLATVVASAAMLSLLAGAFYVLFCRGNESANTTTDPASSHEAG